MGGHVDVYKYVIFIDLLDRMSEFSSAFTYINVFTGATRYDISSSVSRGIGIDSMYAVGRHFAALARRNGKYRKELPFSKLMKMCRLVNGMEADKNVILEAEQAR